MHKISGLRAFSHGAGTQQGLKLRAHTSALPPRGSAPAHGLRGPGRASLQRRPRVGAGGNSPKTYACLECLLSNAAARGGVRRQRLVAQPTAHTERDTCGRASTLALSARGDGAHDGADPEPSAQEQQTAGAEPAPRAEGGGAAPAQGAQPGADSVLVALALALLRFYKREISPLLPMSCRFVPTCSEYAMLSFKKFGALRGLILTAWRLVRCSPIGPSGYDPPVWPPVWKAG